MTKDSCNKYGRFQTQVPGARFLVSSSRRQVPGVRCQVPGVRLQVSGSRFQVPGVRFQVPGSRFFFFLVPFLYKLEMFFFCVGLKLLKMQKQPLMDNLQNRFAAIVTYSLEKYLKGNLFLLRLHVVGLEL